MNIIELLMSLFKSSKFPSTESLMERGINFDSTQIPPVVAADWLKFDLEYLKRVQDEIGNLPRYQTLKSIAEDIVSESPSDIAAFEKIVFFCQAVSKNFQARQPVYDTKGADIVTDPLLLLKLKEMRCGHIARLACDICQALGWRARLVQLGGHVSAEAYIDSGWRIMETDLLGGGEIPKLPNGDIPSVAQLGHSPEALDKLFFNGESTIYYTPDTYTVACIYPSYYFFSKQAYGTVEPAYYEKKPITANSDPDHRYGWSDYVVEKAPEIQLQDFGPAYTPGAPMFTDISRRDGKYFVRWSIPTDRTGHFSKFHVLFSSKSRGFNPKVYFGDLGLQKYWVSPPQDMSVRTYKSIFRYPLHDHKIETESNFLYLDPEIAHHFPYVTVMPTDSYGESIGKIRWADTSEHYLPHFDQLLNYVAP